MLKQVQHDAVTLNLVQGLVACINIFYVLTRDAEDL